MGLGSLGCIMLLLLHLVTLISLKYALAANPRPLEDRIVDLPGVNFEYPFEQYSGYLNASDGVSYHYWFLESQSNPNDAPLVLFLNGGPGCSSLAALLTECGPFRIKDSGKVLVENLYSWNKVSNVIFLESPAGTGFSYSNGQLHLNDDQSVLLHYRALMDFYGKFPEFGNRALFLAGQSYAAVYVSTLARMISKNKDAFPGKLQGVSIGNGLLSMPHIITSRFYYIYYHGLIDEKLGQSVRQKCCLQDNPLRCELYQYLNGSSDNVECKDLVQSVMDSATIGMDPFNIHFECYRPNSEYSDDEECGVPFGLITKHYLDRPDVRRALHIYENRFNGHTFEACSAEIPKTYEQQYFDLTEVIKELITDHGIRLLIYNGDYDSVITFLGAQWFVDGLGISATSERSPILYSQISQPNVGYQQQYGNLDFLVVKGAGHYVPADKPRESLQIFANFLKNERNYSTKAGVDTTPAPLIRRANSGSTTMVSVESAMIWTVGLLMMRKFTLW